MLHSVSHDNSPFSAYGAGKAVCGDTGPPLLHTKALEAQEWLSVQPSCPFTVRESRCGKGYVD